MSHHPDDCTCVLPSCPVERYNRLTSTQLRSALRIIRESQIGPDDEVIIDNGVHTHLPAKWIAHIYMMRFRVKTFSKKRKERTSESTRSSV